MTPPMIRAGVTIRLDMPPLSHRARPCSRRRADSPAGHPAPVWFAAVGITRRQRHGYLAGTDDQSRREHEAGASPGPVLVLLAALSVVGLAGLRGQISGLGWNGPLHREVVPVGIGLEAVLAVLPAITSHRLG